MVDNYLNLDENLNKNKSKYKKVNLPFSAPYEVEDPYPSLSDYHDYEPQVVMITMMMMMMTLAMTMMMITMVMMIMMLVMMKVFFGILLIIR